MHCTIIFSFLKLENAETCSATFPGWRGDRVHWIKIKTRNYGKSGSRGSLSSGRELSSHLPMAFIPTTSHSFLPTYVVVCIRLSPLRSRGTSCETSRPLPIYPVIFQEEEGNLFVINDSCLFSWSKLPKASSHNLKRKRLFPSSLAFQRMQAWRSFLSLQDSGSILGLQGMQVWCSDCSFKISLRWHPDISPQKRVNIIIQYLVASSVAQ